MLRMARCAGAPGGGARLPGRLRAEPRGRDPPADRARAGGDSRARRVLARAAANFLPDRHHEKHLALTAGYGPGLEGVGSETKDVGKNLLADEANAGSIV